MNHPEELLAGYVDGSLSQHERAVVDAHLVVCDTCREEVELAAQARRLVSDLPEVPVPVGVTGPVVAEASRQMASPVPMRIRSKVYTAVGLAAAVVVVAVIALSNLPGIGGGGVSGGGGGAERTPAPASTAIDEALRAVPLEAEDTNYNVEKARDLARAIVEKVQSGSPVQEPSTQFEEGGQQAADAAVSCLQQSGAVGQGDTLVRLIDAKWKGTPAYLGVFTAGPGAGQAPDTVIVLAVDKQACSTILSYSAERI